MQESQCKVENGDKSYQDIPHPSFPVAFVNEPRVESGKSKHERAEESRIREVARGREEQRMQDTGSYACHNDT